MARWYATTGAPVPSDGTACRRVDWMPVLIIDHREEASPVPSILRRMGKDVHVLLLGNGRGDYRGGPLGPPPAAPVPSPPAAATRYHEARNSPAPKRWRHRPPSGAGAPGDVRDAGRRAAGRLGGSGGRRRHRQGHGARASGAAHRSLHRSGSRSPGAAFPTGGYLLTTSPCYIGLLRHRGGSTTIRKPPLDSWRQDRAASRWLPHSRPAS